jgi:prepilin-type N-terminal cleavage/methylation domain-containing protein
MKTQRTLSCKAGFTLVEVMVVITVVAVITGLTLSSIGGAMRTTRNTATRATVMALRTAVSEYEAHYNRLPSTARSDLTVNTAAGSHLLSALLGENTSLRLNPARQRFLDLTKMAQLGRDGFVGEGGTLGLVDYWGEPFTVILDMDGDQWLTNPDEQNEDQRISSAGSSRLPSRVLVFSKGEDR